MQESKINSILKNYFLISNYEYKIVLQKLILTFSEAFMTCNK